MADLPLKALDCGQWDLVDQQEPEELWQDTVLEDPGLVLPRQT